MDAWRPLAAAKSTILQAKHDPLCARCQREPVRRLGDPSLLGTFCEACIDRCHEATEFDHTCPVCAGPAVELEARE